MKNASLKINQLLIVSSIMVFALAITIKGNSQVLSFETVKSNKFDYTKLAQIDTLVNKYISNRWLIGSTVIIVKDNQVVYHKGFGYANEASKKAMPSNAIYRIMSQTKAITSLAIMQLYEQGKISLDQNVSTIIASFKNPTVLKDFNEKDSSYTTVPAKRELTIRDLLTHTSGIDYTAIGSPKMKAIYSKAGIPSGLGDFNASLLDRMKILGTLPLKHQPGEKFTYGLNSDLLGCIVEDIQRLVKSTGFYRAKAKNIKSLSSKIVTDYDGKVPNKLEDLITFPGVGRKTANVVLGHAFGIPNRRRLTATLIASTI